MKKTLGLFLSLFILLGIFSGCSSKNKGKTDDGSTSKNSGASSQTSGATIDTDTASSSETAGVEPKTVFLLVREVGDPYWLNVQKGAEAAASQENIKLIVGGVMGAKDVDSQIEQLLNAVSLGADAIIIAPTSRSALAQTVSDVYTANIPVILVDSLVDSDNYSAAYMTNPKAAGQIGAREMLQRISAQGLTEADTVKIGIMVGIGDSTMMIERLNGFNDYWDKNAPTGWTVLNDNIKISDGTDAAADLLVAELTAEHPDIKGWFGADSLGSSGILAAQSDANMVLVGVENTKQLGTLIKAGNPNVVAAATNDSTLGEESVRAAVKFLGGYKTGVEEEKIFDTGVLLIDAANPQGKVVYLEEEGK